MQVHCSGFLAETFLAKATGAGAARSSDPEAPSRSSLHLLASLAFFAGRFRVQRR